MLRHTCILGDPQRRGQNFKWLPHSYLLGGHNQKRHNKKSVARKNVTRLFLFVFFGSRSRIKKSVSRITKKKA